MIGRLIKPFTSKSLLQTTSRFLSTVRPRNGDTIVDSVDFDDLFKEKKLRDKKDKVDLDNLWKEKKLRDGDTIVDSVDLDDLFKEKKPDQVTISVAITKADYEKLKQKVGEKADAMTVEIDFCGHSESTEGTKFKSKECNPNVVEIGAEDLAKQRRVGDTIYVEVDLDDIFKTQGKEEAVISVAITREEYEKLIENVPYYKTMDYYVMGGIGIGSNLGLLSLITSMTEGPLYAMMPLYKCLTGLGILGSLIPDEKTQISAIGLPILGVGVPSIVWMLLTF